jgi:RNA polymerase sigma-70 factor (ECF subfamily)
MRVTGDFATAEALVQDAVHAALKHWPMEGIPDRPDAWLFTVARRRAVDGPRRADNYRGELALLQWPVQPAGDERLRLIFTCCHPALPGQSRSRGSAASSLAVTAPSFTIYLVDLTRSRCYRTLYDY